MTVLPYLERLFLGAASARVIVRHNARRFDRLAVEHGRFEFGPSGGVLAGLTQQLVAIDSFGRCHVTLFVDHYSARNSSRNIRFYGARRIHRLYQPDSVGLR